MSVRLSIEFLVVIFGQTRSKMSLFETFFFQIMPNFLRKTQNYIYFRQILLVSKTFPGFSALGSVQADFLKGMDSIWSLLKLKLEVGHRYRIDIQ